MEKYSLTGVNYIRASQMVARILYEAGVADCYSDARLICEHVFGMEQGRFILSDNMVTEYQANKILEIIGRRAAGEPLQYILGEAWFMGLRFNVCPGVLIPRRDSEVLVDSAIRHTPQNASVLDMCCGSGCLGITLAANRPDIRLMLADISGTACDTSRSNAVKHGIQADIIQTDLFSALTGRCFNMILCNPPYIPSSGIDELDIEVALHEPRLALDGGEDGLDFYRRILDEARYHLSAGGCIGLEYGYGQHGEIIAMLDKYGYSGHDILFDMEGRQRAAFAFWR